MREREKVRDVKSSSKYMSHALGILKMKTSNSFMHDSLSVEALNVLLFPLYMNCELAFQTRLIFFKWTPL
jgi:hypothetical protein